MRLEIELELMLNFRSGLELNFGLRFKVMLRFRLRGWLR